MIRQHGHAKCTGPIVRAAILLLLVACSGCSRPSRGERIPATPARQPVCSETLAELTSDYIASITDHTGPTRLTLSEDQLNSLLCTRTNASLQDGRLWVTQQHLIYRVPFGRSGQHHLLAAITPNIHDGNLQVAELDIATDGRPWPKWVTGALARAANDALTDMGSPLCVEQLTLSEGGVILTGTIE